MIVLLCRFVIGAVFCVSGFEKLISPYQNFLFVIQSYSFLPRGLETPMAHIVPWIELIIGLFLLLGLWIKQSAAGAMVLFVMFIAIVSQAMIRQLPIEDCGCFGEMASFPLYFIVCMDTVLLVLSLIVNRNPIKAQKFSLDSFLSR